MPAWRALLYCRVSELIRSVALSVAFRIAFMRAACSLDIDSSSSRWNETST